VAASAGVSVRLVLLYIYTIVVYLHYSTSWISYVIVNWKTTYLGSHGQIGKWTSSSSAYIMKSFFARSMEFLRATKGTSTNQSHRYNPSQPLFDT
jgi:hypothetical protein